jgi:predicted GIY-YIG superfamily endonuclease
MSKSIYQPYFYIIEDLVDNKYYAGSKYGIDADPAKLLIEDGYHTSSSVVKNEIKIKGINNFKIRKIKLFSTANEAYSYETRFLKKVNAKDNILFYNNHNNNGPNDIHFSSKGMIWYNNGKRSTMFFENDAPSGWAKGRLIDVGANGKGKVYYNNGKQSKRFFEGMQPDGWVKGNLGVSGEKNPFFNKKSTIANKTCYTNGKDIIYLSKDDEVPLGYYKGQSDSFRSKRRQATMGQNNPRYGSRGEKWFNNGFMNKLFIPGQEPPDFMRGMVKRCQTKTK